MPERNHRIDTRRASRRRQRSEGRYYQDEHRDRGKGGRIESVDLVKHGAHQTHGSRGPAETAEDSSQRQRQGLVRNQLHNTCTSRPERHADTDLVRALGDLVCHHAIDPEHRQHERQA